MEQAQQNLLLAIKASLIAGKAIMKVYDSPSYTSELKDDKSPLTEADKASSIAISELLLSTKIPVINEEIKNKSYDERKFWKDCWIVDPLDGTKEFIKRNGEFTVNIAYYSKDLFLGVIYVPVTRELYYTNSTASDSFKTIANDNHEIDVDQLFNEEDRISPSEATSDKIRVVGSRSHMNQDTEVFIDGLKSQFAEIEIVSKGSSLKFCLVAEGKADVYPRFAPTMEWDTAAGQAICEAAGLMVISKETNNSLKYNKENLLNPYFVVRQ